MRVLVRLFVAVEIENSDVLRNVTRFRDAIVSCSKGKGIKGVEDENIHLTLRFIGEVPDSYVPQISECVSRANEFTKFQVRIEGVGAFPSVSRPRVLWVGITEGFDKLRAIRNRLEECLRRYAEPDREEFVPHITVGRVKGSYDNVCLKNVISTYENTLFGLTQVSKVKLKKSILRPEGPVYTDITVVDLKDG
ncbi:MAG: RNA 2',3'-cyclic phosphodiesterase [Zestosphaera sp.]